MVLMTQGFLAFVRVLNGILAEMRSANQLRPDINLEAVRSALMGMFEGLLRDQMRQQGVRSDVERHAQKDIGAALV